MKLPPGLGASWLDPLRGPPAHPVGDDPVAALPPHVAATDDVERELLAIGGAAVALRRRGLAWVVVARSLDRPLPEVLTLARHYALRAAAEVTRDALDVGAGADPRSERRRSKLPNPRRPAVAAARRAADEAIVFVSPNGNRSKQYQGRFS